LVPVRIHKNLHHHVPVFEHHRPFHRTQNQSFKSIGYLINY
jgi:hypothetical protein